MKGMLLCLLMTFLANIVYAQTEEKNYFRDAFRNSNKPVPDSLLKFPLTGHLDYVMGSGPIPFSKKSFGMVALRVTDVDNNFIYEIFVTNASVEEMMVDKEYCRLMILHGKMLVKNRGNIKHEDQPF